MLHSVAHATLSLRCIKVSREKSCNEQGRLVFVRHPRVRLRSVFVLAVDVLARDVGRIAFVSRHVGGVQAAGRTIRTPPAAARRQGALGIP